MAMTIFGDECISCGDCEPVCPTGAIRDGGFGYRIDRSRCTECEGSHDSPRCVAVCPVDHCIVRLAASPLAA
ncbi:MAG: 4Fe-4S dicluster domain-containing protein [Methylococcaceae bacterium]|nr:4Fe-4S dicluster domain-containing protein [Methylococcaceae bacterium]